MATRMVLHFMIKMAASSLLKNVVVMPRIDKIVSKYIKKVSTGIRTEPKISKAEEWILILSLFLYCWVSQTAIVHNLRQNPQKLFNTAINIVEFWIFQSILKSTSVQRSLSGQCRGNEDSTSSFYTCRKE